MTWTHAGFAALADLVAERTGLTFPPNRRENAAAGIERAMRRAGATDPGAYRDRVAADPAAFDALVAELTVGETYFFRDVGQFDFIRRTLLPAARHRAPDHVFRAWSAGCATGEEAYSLAMLLEQEGRGDCSFVLATDVSLAALGRAVRARYRSWSLRGDGAALAAPYLVREGDEFVVEERVRRRVRLAYLNLALDTYPSFASNTWDMDLILCRNVLIYLGSEVVNKVARRFFEALAPGGWLLTGASDPPLPVPPPVETVVTEAGVFYRRRTAGQEDGDVPAGRAEVLPAADVVIHPDGPNAPPSSPGAASRPTDSGDPLAEATAAARHIRALANRDASGAEAACAAAVRRHPLSAELAYLHAALRLDRGREEAALESLRRVLYLDRSLAVAHYALGAVLLRRGDKAGARRAFRNARGLCGARPPDEEVALAEGETAGRLAEAAAAQLALLAAPGEAES